MNTDTTDNGTGSAKSAFGDKGTNVNAIAYGHPYADQIIEEARDILEESETGRILLRVLDQYKIPIHVMKGTSESGFSPDMKTIFLNVPGKVSKVTGEIVFNFAKSIREADLEYSGHKTPDPMKDLMAYAGFMHARNLDTLTHTCLIVKELTNSSYYSVLLDSLDNLGFNDFYKAYLSGVSKDKLYDYYAEAYDK